MALSAKGTLAVRIAIGYALAALAGAAAAYVHMPLAWVLGPLIAAAVLGMSGFDVAAPTNIRRAGQLVIGTTVGLGMTGPVLASLAQWLPAMIVTALISIFVSGTVSVVLARAARIDRLCDANARSAPFRRKGRSCVKAG